MDIDITDDDLRFEEEVMREPYKLRGWLRYLDHKGDGPARTLTILYERAVKNLPGSYKLWRRYLLHRRKLVMGLNPIAHAEEYRKATLCFERALLLLHKMPRIWLDYLHFLAKQPDPTATRRGFDRALRALPVTQHDRIWPLYLKFARRVGGVAADRVYARYLNMWPGQSEGWIDWCVESQRWREAAERLVAVLDDTGFKSPRGTTTFQLWKQLAAIMRNRPGETKGLRVEAILRDGISRFSDQVGELWAALASHFIALGNLEQARDVYEEAVASVGTVRDFSLVFDAYAEFEESAISAEMEAEVNEAATSDRGFLNIAAGRQARLDLRLLRFERLMDRRPFLVNDVVLRQNPDNVQAWLKRVQLWEERRDGAQTEEDRQLAEAKVVETFDEAVKRVVPYKANSGTVAEIWLAYARHYVDQPDQMRAVLDRAVMAPYKTVAELADVYVAYAESELACDNPDGALMVLTRATAMPKASRITVDYRDESIPAQHRVFKSLKVWSLLVDLEESLGAVESARMAYDRIMELKIATPQVVVNYANFLEEHSYFEDSFRVYERGIELFGYPVAIELWNIYLRKFVARYAGTKLERTRDLFEQALEKCPETYAKPIYLSYGKLEEEHGLARRALRVYERATHGVLRSDRLEMYQYYIAKTAELLGVPATRAIYERGIEELADKQSLVLATEYAQTERQLGEIDRARALYGYASQFADPRIEPKLWTTWHEFEVQHGNEDTFKEMLRIKRSVQAKYNTDAQFIAALEVEKQKQRAAKSKADEEAKKRAESVAAAAAAANNPDELAVEFDDEDL
ncbi:pre-mRNA-splicing factor SYF1 [Martensiomyces pterosporus]|nr:pre-mRNA-splicing factor SYF1 [Martensiomyces pterosporus]